MSDDAPSTDEPQSDHPAARAGSASRGRNPRRLIFAAVLLIALAVALSVAVLRSDWRPGATGMDLGAASVATLDTVSLARGPATVHVDGTVVETDGDTLWLAWGGASFPVLVRDTASWADESRVLVVGRLREADGRRWLDAREWTRLGGGFVAPPDSGRIDTARFVAPADRSGAR